jgi:hypothetical protein
MVLFSTYLIPGKIDGKSGRGSYSGLDEVLQSISSGVKESLSPFLCATESVLQYSYAEKSTGSEKSVDFLVNSIWVPVFNQLVDKHSAIFSIGIPSVLSSCYNAIGDFLLSLQGLVGENYRTAAGRRLTTHTSVKQLQSKWKLDIYFQLRCNEQLGRIEKACYSSVKHGLTSPVSTNACNAIYQLVKVPLNEVNDSDEVTNSVSSLSLPIDEYDRLRNAIRAEAGENDYQCPLFIVFSIELMTCLQKSVLLSPLASKFCGQIIRLFLRIEAQISVVSNINTPSFAKIGTEQLKLSVLNSLNKSNTDLVSTPSKKIATTNSSNPSKTQVNTNVTLLSAIPTVQTVEELIMFVQDLLKFYLWVRDRFRIKVHDALFSAVSPNRITSESSSILKESVEGCFSSVTRSFHTVIVSLWGRNSQLLAGECKRILISSVKAIAGKFRLTNKPPPDAPSAYVETVYQSFRFIFIYSCC